MSKLLRLFKYLVTQLVLAQLVVVALVASNAFAKIKILSEEFVKFSRNEGPKKDQNPDHEKAQISEQFKKLKKFLGEDLAQLEQHREDFGISDLTDMIQDFDSGIVPSGTQLKKVVDEILKLGDSQLHKDKDGGYVLNRPQNKKVSERDNRNSRRPNLARSSGIYTRTSRSGDRPRVRMGSSVSGRSRSETPDFLSPPDASPPPPLFSQFSRRVSDSSDRSTVVRRSTDRSSFDGDASDRRDSSSSVNRNLGDRINQVLRNHDFENIDSVKQWAIKQNILTEASVLAYHNQLATAANPAQPRNETAVMKSYGAMMKVLEQKETKGKWTPLSNATDAYVNADPANPAAKADQYCYVIQAYQGHLPRNDQTADLGRAVQDWLYKCLSWVHSIDPTFIKTQYPEIYRSLSHLFPMPPVPSSDVTYLKMIAAREKVNDIQNRLLGIKVAPSSGLAAKLATELETKRSRSSSGSVGDENEEIEELLEGYKDTTRTLSRSLTSADTCSLASGGESFSERRSSRAPRSTALRSPRSVREGQVTVHIKLDGKFGKNVTPDQITMKGKAESSPAVSPGAEERDEKFCAKTFKFTEAGLYVVSIDSNDDPSGGTSARYTTEINLSAGEEKSLWFDIGKDGVVPGSPPPDSVIAPMPGFLHLPGHNSGSSSGK